MMIICGFLIPMLIDYHFLIFYLLFIPATSVRGGDIATRCSVRTYVRTSVVRMCVCNTFTVYMITRKILERSAPIFVDTLGTLGQQEFAFGFCGSIGGTGSEKSIVPRSVLFEHSRLFQPAFDALSCSQF